MAASVDTVKHKFHYYLSQVDKELAKHPVANQFEKTTHVPKAWAAVGGAAVFVILLFFNVAGPLLTNLLGWLYPAWASFRALETANKDDDSHWLTYWVIFGFVSTAEFFSSLLVYYIPFYYILKAAFLVWLYNPHFHGARYLYETVFRPYLRSKTTFIDSVTARAKERVSNLTKDAVKELDNADKSQ